MKDVKPPFRADQVGSLLRPAALRDARAKAKAGELDAHGLRDAQDRAIRESVAKQEAIGMPVVTDGEFRRDWWNVDFWSRFDGIEAGKGGGTVTLFSGDDQPAIIVVTGKVRRTKPAVVDDFKFLKSVTKNAVPKITVVAPAVAYHRTGRATISEEAYPDLEEFWADISAALREEIRALGEAGCTYLQVDDTSFAYLCDATLREEFRERGDDPDDLIRTYTRALNDALAGRPAGMTVALHSCRGNFRSTWAAQGGYEPVAETLFNDVNADAYLLEFDSDRAGGFEPLRFLPKGKKVVLGLVTSKAAQLENPDAILRRIDEAARFADRDALCLSPQCGFSSTHHGNALTEDQQWRKLELVLEVSRRAWG
jgi:5-methyltetrahydropteroyltriglutamate--homocysteine methyltransferase